MCALVWNCNSCTLERDIFAEIQRNPQECNLDSVQSRDVKLECFSKSKLESKKSIKTRNSFLIVS